MGRQITGVSEQTLRTLLNYDYPGNVRELENIIEHAFILCRGTRIELDCLPKEISSGQREIDLPASYKEETPLQKAEAEIIEKALKKYQGNRVKAAQELGIDRTTLWRKMKKYGLQ